MQNTMQNGEPEPVRVILHAEVGSSYGVMLFAKSAEDTESKLDIYCDVFGQGQSDQIVITIESGRSSEGYPLGTAYTSGHLRVTRMEVRGTGSPYPYFLEADALEW